MERDRPFRLEQVSVRLVKGTPLFSGRKIKEPGDAAALVGQFLCGADREAVCVVNLKTDGTPINYSVASVGALNQAVAEPRELFKSAILSNAASMLMVHNHPSGDLEPSKEDTAITDRMLRLSALLGIPLLDHVIVGGDNSRYFSFREKGILEFPKASFLVDYGDLDFTGQALAAEKGKAR